MKKIKKSLPETKKLLLILAVVITVFIIVSSLPKLGLSDYIQLLKGGGIMDLKIFLWDVILKFLSIILPVIITYLFLLSINEKNSKKLAETIVTEIKESNRELAETIVTEIKESNRELAEIIVTEIKESNKLILEGIKESNRELARTIVAEIKENNKLISRRHKGKQQINIRRYKRK